MTKELREKIVKRIKEELDSEFEPMPFLDYEGKPFKSFAGGEIKSKAQFLAELFVEIMENEILKANPFITEVENG